MPSDGALTLSELLTALAEGLQDEQRRLDEEHLRRLEAFRPVLREARAAGYGALARTLAPPALSLTSFDLKVAFAAALSREERFELRVRPLDAGFTSRYAYSGFAQSSLGARLERIPLRPRPVQTSP